MAYLNVQLISTKHVDRKIEFISKETNHAFKRETQAL
ncbi:uncharacterized protein G2W53_007151 [Senna tora]|uniref:Uncharacterized protein n=1 Tax=Senna tora TaxID=362788 RepID=A0A834X6L0_9FABA|nr:uncharacterized protein G2W53_007151 [Senna tora]